MNVRERIDSILHTAIGEECFPGAVCALARDDEVILATVGDLTAVDDEGTPLPPDSRTPVTADVRYDLASITKVFSAITILSLVDEGTLTLDVPVAEWLPDYRTKGKDAILLTHLLTHTSGLPGTWGGWHAYVADESTDRARWMPAPRPEVLGRILALDLERPPGTGFEYSCLGYITAMAVAETATGRPWDRLISERVLTPLGLARTGFGPVGEPVAPTEFQREFGRGLVRGVVHDETAFALGGVSANAGLFSDVHDLLALGRGMLAGLPGLLEPESFRLFWDDRLPVLLGPVAEAVEAENGFGQSLGLRIGRDGWLDGHARGSRGHGGFTGTQLLADPAAGTVIVLLSNRVHPSRDGPDLAPVRAALAEIARQA